MDLQKLFEIQAGLDYHIIKEKGLEGQNLLDEKILALQVELGELANEWRGFKFWSKDQIARTHKGIFCFYCAGHGFDEKGRRCEFCEEGFTGYTNPLLEEYVDCLHFILSIGLELDPEIRTCAVEPYIYDEDSITNQFIELNYQAYLVIKDYEYVIGPWFTLINLFAGLGEMLGFTWEQIEQAYLEKNKINHERQLSGY